MKIRTKDLREVLTVSQCVAMYPLVSEERIVELVELGELQAMKLSQDGNDSILIEKEEFIHYFGEENF
ncbi:MAG TPA: hypothetical protein DCO72_02720 [Ruminococcus sp.]|nr:hypothetical protein [Ruminococcus sp.]